MKTEKRSIHNNTLFDQTEPLKKLKKEETSKRRNTYFFMF